MSYSLNMDIVKADHENLFYVPAEVLNNLTTGDIRDVTGFDRWDVNPVMMRPADGEICEGTSRLGLEVCLDLDAHSYFEIVPKEES